MTVDAARAPCGLFTLSADGVVLDANPALSRLLGVAPPQPAGQRLESLAAAGGRLFVNTHLLPLLHLQGRAEEIHVALRDAAGAAVPVLLTAVRRGDDPAGTADCAVMVVRQRARFEGELLAARSAAQRAKEELERSNGDLERFAATAAHDLREPLRKVGIFTSILRQRVGDTLGDEVSAQFERVADAVRRMHGMVDGLLALARAGGAPPTREPVALDEVVAVVRADLAPAIEAAGATLRIGALPRVVGDRGLLQQALQNLLGNALKFRRADAPLVVEITGGIAADGMAWLCIADNGRGFPQGTRARLFRPFERLHRGEVEGSGLGLATVQRIVAAHGGRIEAAGEPGVGARFEVRLPAAL
jgi:signal transduction histidine kinase